MNFPEDIQEMPDNLIPSRIFMNNPCFNCFILSNSSLVNVTNCIGAFSFFHNHRGLDFYPFLNTARS